MPSRRGRLILAILAVLAVASLWRAVLVEREKRRIAEAYALAQQQVKQLEEERARLNGELVGARQTIEGQGANLNNLQGELQGLQDRLDKTVVELSSLQREHEQLRQANTSLMSQLTSVQTEKQQLETKLSSLKELKLAIRDVRRKMWNERFAAWHAHIQAQKEADQKRLASGNRGYIIRDGTPTIGSRTTLQVHVLEPQQE